MIKIINSIAVVLIMNASVMAQTSEENRIKTLVEELRLAMVDANKTALEKLAAEDLSYGHSGGQIENKKEFVDKIVSGKSDFTKIELADQTIKITGDVAVVRHKLTGETNNDGKPGTLNLSVLLVWQKQSNEWKLLARQAVKN
jgi:ketosteroid isomerase-like protein